MLMGFSVSKHPLILSGMLSVPTCASTKSPQGPQPELRKLKEPRATKAPELGLFYHFPVDEEEPDAEESVDEEGEEKPVDEEEEAEPVDGEGEGEPVDEEEEEEPVDEERPAEEEPVDGEAPKNVFVFVPH